VNPSVGAADFGRGRRLARAGVASGYVEHANAEIARKPQAYWHWV
jgi:hypothetical protein